MVTRPMVTPGGCFLLGALVVFGLFGCGDADPTWPPPEPDEESTGPCGGECYYDKYSACTCAADDPCGWVGDGVCDVACRLISADTVFVDSDDCSGACDGFCDIGFYIECTCAVDDPCGWGGDGYCDIECLEAAGVDEMFDDTPDC